MYTTSAKHDPEGGHQLLLKFGQLPCVPNLDPLHKKKHNPWKSRRPLKPNIPVELLIVRSYQNNNPSGKTHQKLVVLDFQGNWTPENMNG